MSLCEEISSLRAQVGCPIHGGGKWVEKRAEARGVKKSFEEEVLGEKRSGSYESVGGTRRGEAKGRDTPQSIK